MQRTGSDALVAAGVVYLLAYPVLLVVDARLGLQASGALEVPKGVALAALLVLGPLSLGPAGCLEIARRFSPVPNRTRLDNARRWVGSISFAISYPAIVGIAGDALLPGGGPAEVLLGPEWYIAVGGFALALVGLGMAAVGLVLHLARAGDPVPAPATRPASGSS